MLRKPFALLLLALLSLFFAGCFCPNTKLNVTIDLDEGLKKALASSGRSIEVDVIGLNNQQDIRWKNYSMTKYWEPNDPVRASVSATKLTFTFNATTPAQTITKQDPHWEKWLADPGDKAMPKLYILAQPPGLAPEDKDGSTDPRRLILPLGLCRWDSTNVQVIVSETGIIPHPAPKFKATD